MGDRRNRKATQRRGLRQNFFQQSYSSSYSASQLILLGYNRYDAWMVTLGLSPLTIVKRMDLAGYVERLHWPKSIERPTAIQYLEKVRAGELRPDADFVTRFCKAIHQSPEVLVAIGQREAAPPEIVEAAMKRIERYAFDEETVPNGLSHFVANEILKGERAGDQLWVPASEINFQQMMSYMEGLYDDLYVQPGMTRDNEMYVEKPSARPVTIASLRSKYQDVVSYYADHLLSIVDMKEMKRESLDDYLAWRGSLRMREFLQSRSNMVYLRTQLETIGYAGQLPQNAMRT